MEVIDWKDGTVFERSERPGFSKNKREQAIEKINNRELIHRNIKNPFLTTDYVDDLSIQNQFLIPQNSNYKE
tara:strand:+ start:14 stop:229 length:216 start_codon:yes stop_codon:yes gene_type:complete